MTGNYRGPAQSICNLNVTQDQSKFIPFIFQNFSKYNFYLFYKKLLDKKNEKVEFEIIPKTNEKYISVNYGCIRFIYTYRFLSSSLDKFVKTIIDNSYKTLKEFEKGIVDNDQMLIFVNEIKTIIKQDR